MLFFVFYANTKVDIFLFWLIDSLQNNRNDWTDFLTVEVKLKLNIIGLGQRFELRRAVTTYLTDVENNVQIITW